MPVYPCPECGAQLRPANPVPVGKKLRCPKCDTVFAPTAAVAGPKKKKPAQPAPAAAAAKATDDDDVGQYALMEEKDTRTAEERMKSAFDPIKDRFKRSARGPALIKVVRPSTWLLGTGILICMAALAGALWSVFPMIFKIEIVQPPDKNAAFRPQQQDGRRFKELTPDEYRDRWMYFGGFVFQFLWGAVVATGGSKMHSLESYALAMTGSIMSIVGPGVPLGIYLANDLMNAQEPDNTYILPMILCFALPGLPVSLMCVKTLRDKDVIAGFAEEKPEEA
jgi:hypothetical protein